MAREAAPNSIDRKYEIHFDDDRQEIRLRGYARWSKEDFQANVAFMRAFSKELKESGVFVSTEGWVAQRSEARSRRKKRRADH